MDTRARGYSSGSTRDRPASSQEGRRRLEALIRRRHRRASTQFGFAVQLGYARLPGRVMRVGEEAHPQIVATLASQMGVDAAVFAANVHGRDTTRREHLLELQRDFGFRSFWQAIACLSADSRKETRVADHRLFRPPLLAGCTKQLANAS